MTTVGRRDGTKPGVYIGRPGPWGNPFKIGRDGNRAEVILKYTIWIWKPEQTELRAAARKHLRGKHLLCFCSPQICHGHILASVAESNE
jgi:hypothetical protein